MSGPIEILESRQLLSASLSVVSVDAKALSSDSQKLRADLAAWKEKAAADVHRLTAHPSAHASGSLALAHTLSADEHAGFVKVSGDVKALIDATIKDNGIVIADLRKLLKHSTPALQTKLTTDIATLKNETTTLTNTATTDAQALETKCQTDLTAILNAVPGSKSDETTANSDVTSGFQTLMTDLTTLSTGMNKFVTDAGA